jgi:hypothetical protein
MCPNCRSMSLGIKPQAGFESFIILVTATRKYFCRDCGTSFRAPDRRKTPREANSDASAVFRRSGR